MDLEERHYYVLFLMLGLYLGCSKLIFDQVYDTIKVVVDEEFHIPQAKAYCDGKFDEWNPKITTLPGLYLAVVNFVKPIATCNTYNLRLFNLLASAINMALLYILLDIIYGKTSNTFKTVLQALNIALLPPLYFFSHVFYTDTLALTCLLLFVVCVIKRTPFLVFIFGMLSILSRQINVVWLFMFCGQKSSEELIRLSRVYANNYIYHRRRRGNKHKDFEFDPDTFKRTYNASDWTAAINFHYEKPFVHIWYHWKWDANSWTLVQMFLPIIFFIMFLYANGSIVVGDKVAHVMTVNFPQIFYFLLFYGFFGLPFVLARLKATLQFMLTNKQFVAGTALLALAVVHFNTVVHPYLLADNRHYTFYIWNRWFGKYPEAIYLTVPVYVFLASSFVDILKDQNCITFLGAYYTCLIPGLCFQSLLEMRYFIVPYIIARLRFPRPADWVVIAEFLWYMAINAVTFYIFFTKEIKWEEYDEPQRIIW